MRRAPCHISDQIAGKGGEMFKCDHTKLRLFFNAFHNIEKDDMPEYGEFCLIQLKDGSYTGGKWHPADDDEPTTEGKFARGFCDSIEAGEVARWHSLSREDLSNCLDSETIENIYTGEIKEDENTAVFSGFKLIKNREYPKNEQYCLLILMNGRLAGGRWDKWNHKEGGSFDYASAGASYSMKEVWAWTPLSSDRYLEMEEEKEAEKKHEEELNRNPELDPDKFIYGKDVKKYYERALRKLRKEYPWATVSQMKKKGAWKITPLHGHYVFGQESRSSYDGSRIVKEWTGGSTADEFIDFLCEYAKQSVTDSDPEKKFKYGTDIEVYLDKAFENVKKDYRWADKKKLRKNCRFVIKKVSGVQEFVREYDGGGDYVCDVGSAEEFIKDVERDYQNAALSMNPVVKVHEMKFGRIEIHGWYLEWYKFFKLKSGDYKVSVQAGDRTTGGTREFFITPYCFEAESFEDFLDRYLEIVPGGAFGLGKEELLKDEELKSFLGY